MKWTLFREFLLFILAIAMLITIIHIFANEIRLANEEYELREQKNKSISKLRSKNNSKK